MSGKLKTIPQSYYPPTVNNIETIHRGNTVDMDDQILF